MIQLESAAASVNNTHAMEHNNNMYTITTTIII